jgi:hypothetical protein
MTRSEAERIGRRRAFARAGLLGLALLLAQVPLRVATADWSAASGQSFLAGCIVPTRLALALDLAFIVVAVVFGHRTLQLIRLEAGWPSRLRTAGAGLFWVLLATAAFAVIEDGLLWSNAAASAGNGCASLWLTTAIGDTTVPYTVVVRLLFAVTVIELLIVRLIASRAHAHPPADFVLQATGPLPTTAASRNGSALAGTVICASGSGIRGAAFSLGGLQQLLAAGIYQSARAVIGVSGGGYAAASYHVLRAASTLRGYTVPPYDQISPEMTRLRRETNHLVSSPWVAIQGILSLLFGIAVNITVVLVYLRLTAWLLGWAFSEYGIVAGLDDATSYVSFDAAPYWMSRVWWLALVGGALLVGATLANRFRPAGYMATRRLTKFTVTLLGLGLAASVVFLGVPAVVSASHNLATVNEPTPLIGGLVVITLAILAVVRAAQASTDGRRVANQSRVLTRLADAARDAALPWLASIVIGVSLFVVLLRWTADLTRSEELRSQWWLLACCVGILLFTKFVTDANRSSLHHLYRQRLSEAYLVRRNGESAEPVPYQTPLRFAETFTDDGGPALVMCAAANIHDVDFVSAERSCTPFVFDRSTIGLTGSTLPGGVALTQARLFEHRADSQFRDATIPATMAISGAAFSPLTGRRSVRSASYRFVLALANARLGVWLPNPYWIDPASVVVRLVSLGMSKEAFQAVRALSPADVAALRLRLGYKHDHWVNEVLAVPKDTPDDVPVPHLPNVSSLPLWLRRLSWNLRSALDKPGPYRLFKEAFGKSSIFDPKLYISDGGNYDGLGLVEALRRRPAEIFILDATNESRDSFRTLGESIATARTDLGVDVRVSTDGMRSGPDGRAPVAWAKGSATYPDGRTAAVYVAKAVLTDNLASDIEAYADIDPAFPTAASAYGHYPEWELEAYRVLGREAVRLMVRDGWVAAEDRLAEVAPASAVAPSP